MPDARRLSIGLGKAFPTLSRPQAGLGIHPAQGVRIPVSWDRVPRPPGFNGISLPFALGLFKGKERPDFPQGICFILHSFSFL